MTGTVFDIKEMTVHDGPGSRVTVFFKGCPLRCRWCHNPEGLSPKPQLMVKENLCVRCGLCKKGCTHKECQPFGRCVHACPKGLVSVSGTVMSSEELAGKIQPYKQFFDIAGGGVTFSGGEPLLQGEFVRETAKRLNGIHKALQTSGYAENELFASVLEQMDYCLFDVKIADRERHREFTGVYNDKILKNLQTLKNSGKPFVIRVPLIPNITDTKSNLEQIAEIAGDTQVEVMKYNVFAGAKYKMVGMEYPLGELEPTVPDLSMFKNVRIV